jgi:hypothetical protein
MHEARWPVLILAGVVLAAAGCTSMPPARAPSPWPPAVAAALEQAGPNRPELERVLAHYAALSDPEKRRAAEYLIANMAGHNYALLALYDTTKVEVPFDVLAYQDYPTLEAAFASIEKTRGKVDYDRKEIFPDLKSMRADLLIEHIDLAFAAWRERPWARALSFDDFLAYVLPYRGSNEPLESWRPFFLSRYARLPDAMKDPTDPIEAAALINRDLREWFRFDPRFYYHPTDQGLSEMLQHKLGRCEDMTNLTIYAMRACGLGVTSDYTPFWADAANNHAWNAILDRQGQVIMFMGAEADPGSYRLSGRAAKVYRKTYAEQKRNLAFVKPAYEKVPGWLAGKDYLDVTAQYGPVSDVTVALARAVPDSAHYAYLCVFNAGEWQAIHWAPIENGRATFTDMGRNIAYLPAFFVHGKIVPAAPAFILQTDGTLRALAPREGAAQTLLLASTTRRAQVESTVGAQPSSLEAGREYELFYWKDGWVSVGRAKAGDQPLAFAGAPEGALYWLVGAESSREEERIFTYESDTQVWW